MDTTSADVPLRAFRAVNGHAWESDRVGAYSFRRCAKCALVEEKNTPLGKNTYARGGETVAIVGHHGKLPACR